MPGALCKFFKLARPLLSDKKVFGSFCARMRLKRCHRGKENDDRITSRTQRLVRAQFRPVVYFFNRELSEFEPLYSQTKSVIFPQPAEGDISINTHPGSAACYARAHAKAIRDELACG